MERCSIIRNPASRRQAKPARLEAAIEILRDAGWTVTVTTTSHAGQATQLAREAAANNTDVVIANGGDGTINEIVNGLAGSNTALAVIPGGTANVWAHESRIPKDPAKAVRIVLEGDRRRVDLGVANGRYFLLMAGIGLDAAIIPRVNPWLKRRTGALAYILTGLLTALRTKPWPARVVMTGVPDVAQSPLEESPARPAVQSSDTNPEVDRPPAPADIPATSDQRPATSDQPPAPSDQRPTTSDQRPTTSDQRPATSDQRPATSDHPPPPNDQRPSPNTTIYWMLAGNTRNYGGLVDITDNARIDDGLLDAVIMHRGGLHLLPDAVRLLIHRLRRSPNITYTRARDITIHTPGIPVQLDGERCLQTPLHLTIAPAALTVIVPGDLDSPLFSRSA